MESIEQFAALVAAPRPRLDLGLALIAVADRPQVHPDEILDALDGVAGTVSARDPGGICEELFGIGPDPFRGDRTDYYSPENSLLDRVLDRRLGIPITLSVVAIEVARRYGVALDGIAMPGHFLIAERTGGQLFDPFSGGAPLGRDAARRRFHELMGADAAFEPAHLAPVSNTAILLRVLNNLRGAYLLRGDRSGMLTALRLQRAMPGANLAARRELAGVLAADGRFLEAAEEHEQIAALDQSSSAENLGAAARLRARLN